MATALTLLGVNAEPPHQEAWCPLGESSDSVKEDSDSLLTDSVLIYEETNRSTPSEYIPKEEFIDPVTLQSDSWGNLRGPKARIKHCYPKDFSPEDGYVDDLITRHNSTKDAKVHHDITKYILVSVLPKIDEQSAILEVSQLLATNNPAICCRVAEILEKYLFQTEDFGHQIEILFQVENNVWGSLEKTCSSDIDLSRMVFLDLSIWSYIYCSNTQPSTPQMNHIYQIMALRRERVEQYQNTKFSKASKDMLAAMRVYQGSFPGHIQVRNPLIGDQNVGSGSLAAPVKDKELKRMVTKASFCEKYIFVFSKLRQLEDNVGVESTVECLMWLYASLTKNRETNQALKFLLTRGLVRALRDKYREEEEIIGKKNLNPHKSIVSLLRNIFEEKMELCQLEVLLNELTPLLSHNAECVRDTFIQLQDRYGSHRSLVGATRKEIERMLLNCTLRISPKEVDKENGVCPMFTFKGTMGSTAVTVHAVISEPRCLFHGDVEKCIRKKEKTYFQKHETNLNMLLKLRGHKNVLELMGFQIKPFPFFYILEDCMGYRLLDHLLKKRKNKKWIPCSQLGIFLKDIITVLQCLHNQNVVLRDLTPENFFHINGKVKLADLSLAFVYRSEAPFHMSDMNPEGIPTRWAARECLWKGEFTPASDIYALGLTMYSLWTHGCDPYTELYGKSTEDVLKLVIFHGLQPAQRACIPNLVFELISRCTKTNPSERIKLGVLKENINEYLDTLSQEVDTALSVEKAFLEDKKYPAIDQRQIERGYLPERGIPRSLLELRKKDPYMNNRHSMWIPTHIAEVKPDELMADDCLLLTTEPDVTTVKEPLGRRFVRDVLQPFLAHDLFDKDCFRGQLIMTTDDDRIIQVTRYPVAETLQSLALARSLEQNVNYRADIHEYLVVLKKLAQILAQYHERGWLHRDVCAENVLVNKETHKVYMPRIGRTCEYPKSTAESERFVLDDKSKFENRMRWFAPEVLLDGLFSPANDVYMWATTTWEVLQALEIHRTNPTRDQLLITPFCLVKKNELDIIKQTGEVLEQPDLCPTWLYDLLLKCWRQDRTMRPSMETIVQLMEEWMAKMRIHRQPSDELPPIPSPDDTDQGMPPETPPRCPQDNEGYTLLHFDSEKYPKDGRRKARQSQQYGRKRKSLAGFRKRVSRFFQRRTLKPNAWLTAKVQSLNHRRNQNIPCADLNSEVSDEEYNLMFRNLQINSPEINNESITSVDYLITRPESTEFVQTRSVRSRRRQRRQRRQQEQHVENMNEDYLSAVGFSNIIRSTDQIANHQRERNQSPSDSDATSSEKNTNGGDMSTCISDTKGDIEEDKSEITTNGTGAFINTMHEQEIFQTPTPLGLGVTSHNTTVVRTAQDWRLIMSDDTYL